MAVEALTQGEAQGCVRHLTRPAWIARLASHRHRRGRSLHASEHQVQQTQPGGTTVTAARSAVHEPLLFAIRGEPLADHVVLLDDAGLHTVDRHHGRSGFLGGGKPRQKAGGEENGSKNWRTRHGTLRLKDELSEG